MKAILDTHAFLWALAGDARMSRHARDIFAGPADLSLSIASIWEILIKVQSGKLPFPRPAVPYLLSRLAENRIERLPMTIDHLLALERLAHASSRSVRPHVDCAEHGGRLADHHGGPGVQAVSRSGNLVTFVCSPFP